jgi:hypothetical protein
LAEPTTTTATATAVSWFSGTLSVLLGFGAKSVSDWFNHKRTLQRERETRDALRRDQLAERRANFQRETLLELQEAVQDLARATGASHHHDEMAYRQTGKWQRERLGEELDQQVTLANRRVLLLTVRVRDESLRNTIKEFRQLTNQTEAPNRNASDSELRDASFASLQKAVPLIEQIHERVGKILRTLDDEESSPKLTG